MVGTEGHPCRTCRAGERGSTVRSVESYSKPRELGVNVSERLSLWHVGKAVRGQAMTANRTRENRLSGMIGGLAETWARVKAIRAHNAETPKQTSLHLRELEENTIPVHTIASTIIITVFRSDRCRRD
jgi:hypothetical protein